MNSFSYKIIGRCVLIYKLLVDFSLLAQAVEPSPKPSGQPLPPSTFPPNAGSPTSVYYSGIDPTAVDNELKSQLKELISNHKVLSYDEAWEAFAEVDKYLKSYPCDVNSSHIPDIYSSYCWSPEPNLPTGGECGNYKKEGDCFNREHVWPKSWFGGFDYGDNAQTDLFELWPSDGYVNGLRGNLPFGDVVDPITYTSTNGCRIGKCAASSEYGNCFEVVNYLKGDLARSYFYLSTAYWNEWECCDTVGVNGSDIKTWMENELRKWHKSDVVDQQEVSRNDEIYNKWQGNRNPFIDHPEWVDSISNF